ncbi:hypothetical protein AAC03nite_18860 [Alicyclobacillus acidoterrestris]|uniref:hypothetical protein n=1 Tax=Alicyclobacillus suci TaxID=2816080 RepID=UPI001192E0BA|nr:hypothetical protein [Alicyclobacillus suci]GEO26101.1 hypothetical protein AAC03nite_18860 [Alicyclobacillus acidoterrestris]
MAKMSEKAWVWCLIPAGVAASLTGAIVGKHMMEERRYHHGSYGHKSYGHGGKHDDMNAKEAVIQDWKM